MIVQVGSEEEPYQVIFGSLFVLYEYGYTLSLRISALGLSSVDVSRRAGIRT